MREAWLSFAQAGDPGWAPYDVVNRTTRIFGPGGPLADDPGQADRLRWEGVA